MTTYKITCSVPQDKLHALIQYYEAVGVTGFSVNLAPATDAPTSGRVDGVKSTAVPHAAVPISTTPRPAVAPNHRRFHYVGGIKNKGISARDLVLQILNTSPAPIVSCHDLRIEFVKHGFAKTSISSPLSVLCKEGKITHVGEASYALRQRYVTPSAAANGADLG